jgi:peptide/nickel transport system permease protein
VGSVSGAPSVPRTVRILGARLAQACGVALMVSVVCFLVVQQLPGDAAYRIAAGRYGADLVDSAAAQGVRQELGLDRPMWQQLGDWCADLFTLDLGRSLVTSRTVVDELGPALLATLQLAATALVGAVLIGAVLGTAAARRPGGVVDRLCAAWVAGSRALPPFLLGIGLMVVLSERAGWVSAAGGDGLSALALPALTLAICLSGLFARIIRDAVIEVTQSAYVQFARTKGLPERVVVLRHAIRNALVAVVPYVGVQAVILVEGVVVVESLFSWDGLGHALVHAVFWRDVPVLQGASLVLALVIVAINTGVDLAVAALDPRPRHAGVTA